jgi:hypothetical protein
MDSGGLSGLAENAAGSEIRIKELLAMGYWIFPIERHTQRACTPLRADKHKSPETLLTSWLDQ